jgi:two-component system, OmpR family, alkaline phosphatase synthesis response regulator PhoP
MSKRHILVVDDEEEILQLIEYHLLKSGYACTCVATGTDAIRSAQLLLPDLVLLDLMLPGTDGLQVCSLLKAALKTRHIPIVMVTAKGTEADVVRGLEAGADDYVIKPFSPRVLMARVGAVLRRTPKKGQDEAASIQIHEIVIHPGRHEVLLDGKAVDLSHTEFALVHFLARRPGWVFTRSQIVDALHGPGYPVTDRAVDVQIAGLRKKLGKYENCLETIRGVGYRFKE